MTSINIYWNHHGSHQLQSFVDFMLQNRYSDCALSVEGKMIYVHKIVLAAASPVFMELFQFTQFIPSIVHIIYGVKYQDVINFIDFIYTGSIRLQKFQMKNFLEICKTFNIKGLNEIEVFLANTVLPNLMLKKSPKRLTNKASRVIKLSPRKSITIKAIENCSETSFTFKENIRRSLNFDAEPMEVD